MFYWILPEPKYVESQNVGSYTSLKIILDNIAYELKYSGLTPGHTSQTALRK